MRIGHGLGHNLWNRLLAGGFTTEYQAVYDAYTTKPNDATAAIWNACVALWVANGEWATKDVIYNYAAHTNGGGEALINWKNPGTFDATAFNAPTHTANEGFTGNGANAYIGWNWNPAANGVNYVQDDASMGGYIRTNIAENAGIGTAINADNKDCFMYPRSVGDVAIIRINDATSTQSANLDGSGMYINTRTTNNVAKLYRNKLILVNKITVSIGLPTHDFYSLAYNDDDSAAGLMTGQQSIAFAGGGMTQTNVNNFSDPFNAAMTALGKNVY